MQRSDGESFESFESFGPEWEKKMMKLSKKQLIKLIRDANTAQYGTKLKPLPPLEGLNDDI